MEKQEIKAECENIYELIKNSNERLTYLRNICKHEDISENLYSWRIGSVRLADVCDNCGKLMKYK